jgi:hypothetical protein
MGIKLSSRFENKLSEFVVETLYLMPYLKNNVYQIFIIQLYKYCIKITNKKVKMLRFRKLNL